MPPTRPPDAEHAAYSFGPFTLRTNGRTLTRSGLTVPIGARAFDLLCTLLEEHGRIVGKTELMRRVWPDVAVTDNNLAVAASALRRALQDNSTEPAYIRTISGRGYCFVAPVIIEAARQAWVGTSPALAPQGPAAPAGMPGIAILPFINLSDDPAQDHFGNGIAEDIIADLSRNRWLTVIARNSSFSFRGANVATTEIAEKLGVRYVLDGTIRKAANRVRVTAELIDAETNSPILRERFDRDLADLFSVQDAITEKITASVRPALYEAEEARSMRRRPESLDAWAAYQRGVWHFSRFGQPESQAARAWFERSIALDPQFAPGYYGLGLVFLHDGSGYITGAPSDWQTRGEDLVRQAVALDDRDSHAHSLLAAALMMRGDHAGALESTARALDLNPSDAVAYGTAGATLVFSGRPLEGLEALAACLRLNPREPRLRVRYAHVGLGHYFADQFEQADAVADRIIRIWPLFPFGPRLKAMVLADTGRLAEARAAIDAAIALDPAPFDCFSHARMPWYGAAAHRRALAAFRRAGWTGPA